MKRLFLSALLILMMAMVAQTTAAATAFDNSPKKVNVDSEGTQYNDPLAQNLFGEDGPFSVTTSSPDVVAEEKDPVQKVEEATDTVPEEVQTVETVETVVVASTSVVVKSGDSLSAIARRVYGDGSRYQEIIEANKDKYPSLLKNPDLIHPGWELIIPSETKEVIQSADSDTKTPEVSEDLTVSSPVAEVVKVPNLSTIEKQVRIQKVIYASNKAFSAQGKTIKSITPAVVEVLIKNGFMTKEEWMAMNPPIGYRWEVDAQGVVVLKSADGKEVTTKEIEKIDEEAKEAAEKAAAKATEDKAKQDAQAKEAEEKAAAKATEDKAKQDAQAKEAEEKAAAKATEDKAKQDAQAKEAAEKAAAKATEDKAKQDAQAKEAEEKAVIEKAKADADIAANAQYHKMLSEIGVPDFTLSSGDYNSAISAGSKFLTEGFFGGTTAFYKFYNCSNYPDYNIADLQAELKDAQERYQKAVESKKTSKFLGVFGDTIESTSALVLQKKAKLEERWAELKKAVDESNTKAKELEAKVNNANIAKSRLEASLSKLDQYDAANGDKIQAFIEAIKKLDEANEDDNKKLGYYKTLKKVFP